VLAEATVVAGVAALLGALLAWPAGFVLLALLRNGGLVDDSVSYGGGAASLGATVVAIVLTSTLAAALTARRTTNGPATLAIAEGRAGTVRMPVVAGRHRPAARRVRRRHGGRDDHRDRPPGRPLCRDEHQRVELGPGRGRAGLTAGPVAEKSTKAPGHPGAFVVRTDDQLSLKIARMRSRLV
jgi:hypothetical protein